MRLRGWIDRDGDVWIAKTDTLGRAAGWVVVRRDGDGWIVGEGMPANAPPGGQYRPYREAEVGLLDTSRDRWWQAYLAALPTIASRACVTAEGIRPGEAAMYARCAADIADAAIAAFERHLDAGGAEASAVLSRLAADGEVPGVDAALVGPPIVTGRVR